MADDDDPYFGGVTARVTCKQCGVTAEATPEGKQEHRDWHAEQERPPDAPAE